MNETTRTGSQYFCEMVIKICEVRSDQRHNFVPNTVIHPVKKACAPHFEFCVGLNEHARWCSVRSLAMF